MEVVSQMPVFGLPVTFILIVLNGILFGFSAAVQSLSENEIEKKVSEGSKKAKLLQEILTHPERIRTVIPVSVNACGICVGAQLMPYFEAFMKPYIKFVPAFIFSLLICVVILTSVGMLSFYRIAACHAEAFALRFVSLFYWTARVLSPVTAFVIFLSRLLSVPFGVAMDRVGETVTEEEIISIVDEAHEQGIIEENEAEMIQNIISFNETNAADIMTHRTNVVAFSMEDTLNEIAEVMMEEGKSRYPVYGEDLDDIKAILHYKDIMEYVNRHPESRNKKIAERRKLLREAAFIPETRSIGDLFRSMQAKKIHMAVVVDEYGQTAGIITMEDILEEIVGEIQDEYDEEEILIRMQKDHSRIIRGLTSLDDVAEELEIDFGDHDFETLNGYLTALMGHIPTEKDVGREIAANGYRFTILSLGNRTIDQVKAEMIK